MMHKIMPLAAGISLLFASCQAPRQSRTWEIVKASRHPGPGEQDPSGVYARELHKTLEKSGIAHKVVTFKFRYASRLTLNAAAEDTAVIYRDDSNPAQPWWIMAERLWSPVWVPVQAIDAQISFFVRRPATVVKVEEFSAAPAENSRKPERASKPRASKTKSSGKKSGSKARTKSASNSDSAPVKRKLVRIPLSIPPPVLTGPETPEAPTTPSPDL